MNKLLSSCMKKARGESLRVVAIGCILLFAILPLLSLAFYMKAEDWEFVTQKKNFALSIQNSLRYAGASACITTVLALAAAYLLNASSIKHKNVFVIILTLGMLVPTISVGVGIRTLFEGRKNLYWLLFDQKPDVSMMTQLIMGSVVTAFPATFLIIYDALRYEDKGPYDAASIMGISRTRTFFRLTLPYLKTTLISAFFACFTLIFSDYGLPMEIKGGKDTLPMFLYEEALTNANYGRGMIAGYFLLIPAALSFLFDLVFKDHSVTEKNKRMIVAGKGFNLVAAGLIIVMSLILFLPQAAFVSYAFIEEFPKKLNLTFAHFTEMSTGSHGIGLIGYIQNSLTLAFGTAILGVVFAYMLSYLSVRKEGRLGKAIDLLALSTIAIPGMVLGIGYIYMFKKTTGLFYNTMWILIIVNVFHFLGSPYLLAKNCLSKINRDYEVIGETLGISKLKIIFRVLIPNSVSTLIEMFSYFFLNSMITISAVAFLFTVDNQPLSILIKTYDKDKNLPLMSVISTIILAINILFRILFTVLSEKYKNRKNTSTEEIADLTREQFELLRALERGGRIQPEDAQFAQALGMEAGDAAQLIRDLSEQGLVDIHSDHTVTIGDKGLRALQPYRVRRALILAAGFGSRMAPVTLDTPKPLVRVNGVRIIDTLLDALIAADIRDITIVRGYKKEKFDELLKKYPGIRFIDNHHYNTTNNISSTVCAVDLIDRCYICEADLIVSDPTVINKYEYTTNYLGIPVTETEDWCFGMKKGCAVRYQQGGTNCYQAIGISYWNAQDAERLRRDLMRVYHFRAGKENLWELVPLKIFRANYHVQIRSCHAGAILEIDNFEELIGLDASYRNYPGHQDFVE